MDKTPEINSSPENLKIPENWKFPERDAPGLKVDQINLDERFLALTIPDDLRLRFNAGNSDYFFDPEGNRREYRVYTKAVFSEESSWEDFHTYIHLAGDRDVDYDFRGNRESIVSGLGEVIVRMRFNRGDESVTHFMNHVAAFAFKNGSLAEVREDEYFIEDVNSERKYVASPKLSIGRPVVGGRVGNWKLDPRLKENQKGEFNLQPEYTENKAIYSYKNGEKAFDIEWRVDNGIFLVSQTHIPTGIVKTLGAPLSINLKELADAVFAQPPYAKERKAGQDRLVVP